MNTMNIEGKTSFIIYILTIRITNAVVVKKILQGQIQASVIFANYKNQYFYIHSCFYALRFYKQKS